MSKKQKPNDKPASNYLKVGTGEAPLRSEFYTEKG